MQKKIKKNEFTLEDFLEEMNQVRNMGGIGKLLDMLPGMGGKGMKDIDLEESEKDFADMEAIILSMTKEERANPNLINPSRKQRIAKGAGVDISEVNRLVKQFDQMKKLMKQMGGLTGGKRRGGFGGLGGLMGGKFKMPF